MIEALLLFGLPFALLGGYGIASTFIRWIAAGWHLLVGDTADQDCDR